ncbi:MAG: ATP-binding protein [Firmicutes bacterium]|nr:ATP-binding protein [Bacillota bacterium]
MSDSEREKLYLQLLVDFLLLNEIVATPLAAQFVLKVGLKQSLRLEDDYREARGLEGRLLSEQFVELMRSFLRQLGSEHTIAYYDGEMVVLTCHRCPFGHMLMKAHLLCQVIASVFGGIAARNFSYSKVSVENSLAARRSSSCQITVFLVETARAAGAVGTVFSGELTSYLLTSKEIHSLGEEMVGHHGAVKKYADSLEKLQFLHQKLECEYGQWRNEIFSDLKLGVVAVNEEDKIAYMNETAQKLLRVKEHVETEATGQLQQLLRETRLTGRRHNQQQLTVFSEDEVRYYSVNTAPLYGEGDCIRGAVSVFQDITERKKMENDLQQIEKFSLVAELAAGIAHEIRNPIATMRGFLQLLTNELKPESKGSEYCALMIEEIDRTNAIIREFLLLTKPSAPKQREADLHIILEEIFLLIESKSLLENVELRKNYARSLPLVKVDSAQIKQVFLNLATNAIQAMPLGGVLTISTSAEQGKAYVCFSDTGPGIEEASLSKVFDPFYTTKEGGTGLGLTISYRIAENHGGCLSVQSLPGKGARFTVELPVVLENSLPAVPLPSGPKA